ncbi:MAG TPA: hypothetical protein VKT82_34715 [Ktedonobacterales bacterium]|nr:hypothetical protein [Ktedonobacterales bacterium]
MSYRRLSAEEIIFLGQQLEDLHRWEQVRDFVFALYGPAAHEVTISVLSQYNDSSYDEEANIIVTNREGDRLSYDFSLPFWTPFDIPPERIAEFLEDNNGNLWEASALGEQVEEALRVFCTDKLGFEFLEHWEPRDPIVYIYTVGTPPELLYTDVYVEED